MIETYLSRASRPYLDGLRQSVIEMGPLRKEHEPRLTVMRNFKLLGPHNEMPILEKHSFNITEASKKRCILLYASHNGIYPGKARQILSELKDHGYSGHVLLQIGGFPNTENGGLKICHVPYAFKVAFLREAQLLGYKEVLWLNTAIHPLTNLESIFREIKETGYFFL